MSVPRYYDQYLESIEPELYQKVRRKRIIEGRDRVENNTKARLKVREKVHKARMKLLPRQLEQE